jgi:hypothetical protein
VIDDRRRVRPRELARDGRGERLGRHRREIDARQLARTGRDVDHGVAVLVLVGRARDRGDRGPRVVGVERVERVMILGDRLVRPHAAHVVAAPMVLAVGVLARHVVVLQAVRDGEPGGDQAREQRQEQRDESAGSGWTHDAMYPGRATIQTARPKLRSFSPMPTSPTTGSGGQ